MEKDVGPGKTSGPPLVQVSESPPPEQVKPKSVEALYIDDSIKTLEIMGVEVKIQQIGGGKWTRIAERCSSPGGVVHFSKYCAELIKTCIIEPKDIEFEKLKPGAIPLFVAAIEDVQGVSEVARKNLGLRWSEDTSSTS